MTTGAQRSPLPIRQNHSWHTLLRWALLLLTPLGGMWLALLVYRDWKKRNPQPARRVKGNSLIALGLATLAIIANFALQESLESRLPSPAPLYATSRSGINPHPGWGQFRPPIPRMGYLFWVARPVITHKRTALQLTLDWEAMRLMAPLMAATRTPHARSGRSFMFPAFIANRPPFEGFPMAFWRSPPGNGTGPGPWPNRSRLMGGRFMWGAPPPGPPDQKTT